MTNALKLKNGNNSPLSESIRPMITKGSHPVENGRYLIATNEINSLYIMAKQWIENRAPGGIIHGRPRLGKTRAIHYLLHELPTEFGNSMPIFLHCCKQYRTPSEATFFEDLLQDVGHDLPFNGKTSVKRERLCRFLTSAANTAGSQRIVLIIDDAQRLFEIQYGWLMDISNELDRHGINLTVLLIGQNELLHQRAAFLQSKKVQLVGRFMVHTHKFTGVNSVEDLRACLSGYDEYSEYPTDSGWSFTKYYFPESYAAGFRLQHCAEELMDVFTDIWLEYGARKERDIPMQYLTLTVEYCLRHFGVDGIDVDQLNKMQWREAIHKSGYVEAEVYLDIV